MSSDRIHELAKRRTKVNLIIVGFGILVVAVFYVYTISSVYDRGHRDGLMNCASKCKVNSELLKDCLMGVKR